MCFALAIGTTQYFDLFKSFKTCDSFWKITQNIFENGTQCLYDFAKWLGSLKQFDNDMLSSIVEAQYALEEFNMFLEVDLLNEIKKLDNLLANM